MNGKYRNTAFLVELLVNILVFSVSCAVLVGLFGRAGEIARQTKEEGHATNEINAIMQTFKSEGPEGLFPDNPDEALMQFNYDDKWNPVEEPMAYRVELTVVSEDHTGGVLYRLTGVATNAAGREIGRMQTACYIQSEGAAA